MGNDLKRGGQSAVPPTARAEEKNSIIGVGMERQDSTIASDFVASPGAASAKKSASIKLAEISGGLFCNPVRDLNGGCGGLPNRDFRTQLPAHSTTASRERRGPFHFLLPGRAHRCM